MMIPRSGLNPAAMRSAPVTAFTSGKCGMPGMRSRTTPAAAGSISTVATVRIPASPKALGNPPIPSNRETMVRSVTR